MKNRKPLLLTLGLLLLGAAGWLGFRTVANLRTRKQATAQRQHLASFTVWKGKASETLPRIVSLPTIVVYFHPDCEHCQYEAEQLSRHPVLLKKAQVWLLSTEALPKLRAFAQRYHLDTLRGVTVAHVEPRVAFDSLGFRSVPHLLVYGPDGGLLKEFRGETRWEAVEKAL